jgi:hypothetical protein
VWKRGLFTGAALSRIWALGFFAALSAGCGGSVCQRLQGEARALAEKAARCGDGAVPALPSIDIEACEIGAAECSPDELKQIEAEVACWKKLPNCQSDALVAWVERLAQCAAPPNTVSDVCREAFTRDAK